MGSTSKYNITMLVYYETTANIESARMREKQLKGWVRRRKIGLIESFNLKWVDLSMEWYS